MDWLLAVQEETGVKIPALEKDPPKLFSDLEWIWEGFITLSGRRGYNQAGYQPISFSDIYHYTVLEDLCYNKAKKFIDFVSILDAHYLEHHAKELNSKVNKDAHIKV